MWKKGVSQGVLGLSAHGVLCNLAQEKWRAGLVFIQTASALMWVTSKCCTVKGLVHDLLTFRSFQTRMLFFFFSGTQKVYIYIFFFFVSIFLMQLFHTTTVYWFILFYYYYLIILILFYLNIVFIVLIYFIFVCLNLMDMVKMNCCFMEKCCLKIL